MSASNSEHPREEKSSIFTKRKGRFTHKDAQGRSVTVWYQVPHAAKTQPVTVLFVMHGIQRNAKEYRDVWVKQQADVQEKTKHSLVPLLVLAPEFDKDTFPDIDQYILGNVYDSDKRKQNHTSEWSFWIIESIFDQVLDTYTAAPLNPTYVLFGHSAGAQFVHRFVLFMPSAPLSATRPTSEQSADKKAVSTVASASTAGAPVKQQTFPRFSIAISANSGFYTMPHFKAKFPYGLELTEHSSDALAAALGRRMLVLLGDADTDPNHKSLRRTAGAMEQGQHRFERGQNFFKAGQAATQSLGVSTNWIMNIVPEVAHDSNGMCYAAVQQIDKLLAKL